MRTNRTKEILQAGGVALFAGHESAAFQEVAARGFGLAGVDGDDELVSHDGADVRVSLGGQGVDAGGELLERGGFVLEIGAGGEGLRRVVRHARAGSVVWGRARPTHRRSTRAKQARSKR